MGSKSGVTVQHLLRVFLTTPSPFGDLRALEKQKGGLSYMCAGDPCPRGTAFAFFFFLAISPLFLYTLVIYLIYFVFLF